MAASTMRANPLITTKAPDTPINVQLHPLVLLTISDYMTRHVARQQSGEIVGAIIGRQSGRLFTLESAYECRLSSTSGDTIALDPAFFATRLEQYKDVHKDPPLDLVAVFVLGSVNGPTDKHAMLLQQVQKLASSDNIMLLLFHPEMVDELRGGRLPVTLYESVYEQEGNDATLRFRELSFEVETGEAERIAMDYVAQGGGNAAAVPKAIAAPTTSQSSEGEGNAKGRKLKGKGKAREVDDAATDGSTNVLSPEDDELIASLVAKANAIKMLQQRIELIRLYMASLPQSYLTNEQCTDLPDPGTDFALLRSIKALISRLPLLNPPTSAKPVTDVSPDSSSFVNAVDREKQDVQLTSLLAGLTRAVSEAQSMGLKFGIVQRDKQSKERSAAMGVKGTPLSADGDALMSRDGGGP